MSPCLIVSTPARRIRFINVITTPAIVGARLDGLQGGQPALYYSNARMIDRVNASWAVATGFTDPVPNSANTMLGLPFTHVVL